MNISSTRAHPFTWLRSRMLGNIKPIGPIGGAGKEMRASCSAHQETPGLKVARPLVGSAPVYVYQSRASEAVYSSILGVY